jgi:polar amino acid transport system permease protein
MQAFVQHAREFLPILLQGAVVTVQVTALSFLLSSAIGLVLALGKLSPVRAVSWAASTVVNVIRGLPIIVQLFYIYFVLPEVGIQLTAFQAGVMMVTGSSVQTGEIGLFKALSSAHEEGIGRVLNALVGTDPR